MKSIGAKFGNDQISDMENVDEMSRRIFVRRLVFIACIFMLVTVGIGCSHSEWGTHVRHLIDDTKRQFKAGDIQAVLGPFFSGEVSHNDLGVLDITNKLPAQVVSLPIFSDDPTNIVAYYGGSSNILFLTIGSGFGHWGIAVTRPSSEERPHDKTIISWEDGVYFYNEYR